MKNPNKYHGQKIQGSKKHTRGVSRRIILEQDPKRLAALVLMLLNKGTRYVIKQTGITENEYRYLYRMKLDLKLTDIRNGTGKSKDLSQAVVLISKDKVTQLLTKWLSEKGHITAPVSVRDQIDRKLLPKGPRMRIAS